LYFNLKRYFKYYQEHSETPFTPALPLCYAYNEALDMIFEEGLARRIERHKLCADAFYTGLGSMGLTPFAKPDARSNVVLAVNYLPGIEDKKFRDLLSNEFKVLVAGGFGNLKGKVFRIGSMGEVNKYHVIRTLSSVESALRILGIDVPSDSLNKAMERF
jgi:aspartate aminotransferase-like enzyme